MTFIEKKIKKLLKDKGIDHQEFEHEPVYTCDVAEKVRKRMSQWFNIDWFWFMEPIVACKDPRELGYEYGSCKISEEIGKKIINWPCVLIHVYDYSLSSVFQRIFS